MSQNPNPSLLDHQQILQRCFDKDNDALRTDATVQVDVINADLTVDIRAASGDDISIASQDGSNHLKVNPDGSINVITSTSSSLVVHSYNEITSVASGNLTTIVSKTMTSPGKVEAVEVSGSNVAEYTIEVNSVVIAKARSYFGGSLNWFFDFKDGLPLNTGDVIRTRVIHNRPSLGDFNARMETTS